MRGIYPLLDCILSMPVGRDGRWGERAVPSGAIAAHGQHTGENSIKGIKR